MQTPQQVLDAYFLDIRHALLEIGAFCDRYDAAVDREGLNSGRHDVRYRQLQDAITLLADLKQQDRAEMLLNHFSS